LWALQVFELIRDFPERHFFKFWLSGFFPNAKFSKVSFRGFPERHFLNFGFRGFPESRFSPHRHAELVSESAFI
jgi:hypothetical protein